MAGDLGDLGILTVPLEGDLGPLLAAFDKAEAAAEKAGEDAAQAFLAAQERIKEEAQEAFAGMGQVQLRLEGIGDQQRIAREAADAFKTMGDVQVAAAQRGEAEWNQLAATIERAKEAAARPARGMSAGPTGFFASLSQMLGGQNRRAVADLQAIEGAAEGAGRGMGVMGSAGKKLVGILGGLSGVGGTNAVLMTRLATSLGPLAVAIGVTAGATALLVKGFKEMATLGDRLTEFSKQQAERIGRAFAENQAVLQDAAKGTNRAALVPLEQAVEDAQRAVDAAQEKVADFGSGSLAHQGWENISSFFGGTQETALKNEETALADLAIAMGKLTTERERQRIEKAKGESEKKKTEGEAEEKKALEEEQAELQKASALWDQYHESIKVADDERAAIFGGEDPAVSALRREADAFQAHGEALQKSARQGTQLAGQGYIELAEKIRGAVRAMQELEGAKVTKTSDEELARIQEDSVERVEDATRRLSALRMTEAESAMADLRAQHARELQEIENSEKLKGDAMQAAINSRKGAQAAEVRALAAEHGRLFGDEASKMEDFLGGWLGQLEGQMREAEKAPDDLLQHWRTVLIEIVEEAEKRGVDIAEPLQRVKDQFQRLAPDDWIQKVEPKDDPFKGVLQGLEGAGAQVQGLGQDSSAVAARMQTDFEASFQTIKSGANQAGQAFETWADRMIQKLRELANTKSSGSASGGGDAKPAATGYQGVVGGVGGTDMNLMTFALTRGEHIDIRTADQVRKDTSSRGGPPPIRFVDQVGVRVDVEEGSETADGREMVFIIRQAVTRALRARGGRMRRAIDQGPVGR